MTHDPAYCTEVEICDRCDAYGDGYSAGKAKAHEETRAVVQGRHAQGCGCEPCITVRVVLAVLEQQGEVTL